MIDRQMATSERNVSRPSTNTPVVPKCNDQLASQHLKSRIQNGLPGSGMASAASCKRLVLIRKVQAAAGWSGDTTQVHAKELHRMRLVILEADEWQSPCVLVLNRPVGLANGTDWIVAVRLLAIESVAIFGAFDGHIAGDLVLAVRPPEACSAIKIEGCHLVLLRLAWQNARREVVIQYVIDLSAIFEKVAVAHALETHAVPDHE